MAAKTTETGQHKTLVTNPGIADRLEKDVVGFCQYGFSFERCADASGHGILRAPRSTQHVSVNEGDENTGAPPAHLSVGVPSPSLVPSVGPFLRTLVRISDGVDPRTLRVKVSFDWQEKTDVSFRSSNTAAAKVAHHVHMIVRNSMGAALFLTSLSIVLPGNVSVKQVREAMEQNDDVNYPTIGLIERARTTCSSQNNANSFDNNSQSNTKEGRPSPPVVVQQYLQSNSDGVCARVLVETRMCTVRLTPVLYHTSRALRGEANLLQQHPDNRMVQQSIHSRLPYILACVDKVANLFRIIMLARDYKAQHRLILVVRDERIKAKLGAETNKFIAGLDPADDCGNGSPRVETIGDTVRMLGTECDGNIVAVDLHDDALTLDNNGNENAALSVLRSAGAVIWGFEKDGVPGSIDNLASRYVQVRCRSSLNLVAAMSVVMHRGWSDSLH